MAKITQVVSDQRPLCIYRRSLWLLNSHTHSQLEPSLLPSLAIYQLVYNQEGIQLSDKLNGWGETGFVYAKVCEIIKDSESFSPNDILSLSVYVLKIVLS